MGGFERQENARIKEEHKSIKLIFGSIEIHYKFVDSSIKVES